ncbi:flavin reductase family protein [Amycolatopsis jiangsuensis]|uniref:Flavin reductase (DIM6/NTAB) family NADH-FMN oxidoreductase RutF n=1 Tax=Amycolatopsis jiangsuensis TaxID=1181879 RepID=A0A840IQD9_9PSEU|nr:flavin reductase family protein [Amycolatopsis jiangsuensis]MBB4684110.1 flavin reductase (DIM6/NTAB) family NADH-FMN oxidoreductase RutF [Amycolatopsis jiangsuensis]
MYSSSTDEDHGAFVWMVKNAIVPRPIAWVSTVAVDGTRNLAPFSYFAPVVMDPPTVLFSVTGRTDTLANIEARRQFAITIALAGQEELIAATAAEEPAEVDEATRAGLRWEDGHRIAVPHPAGGGPSLECELLETREFRGSRLVFGEVLGVVVDDRLLRADGRLDQDRYRPVGRMGGATFTRVGNWSRHPVPPAGG